MLKTNIKKIILETKERKEKLLIEEKIINNRFLMIFENQKNIDNFKKLEKSKKVKIINSFISEVRTLDELGLVNEGFVDILKNLFGRAFGGVIETAAEPIVDKVLTAVGFKSDGFFKKFMISFLTTRPSELIKAFTDCKLMTKLLIESFLEGLVMMAQQDMEANSYIFNFVRNELGGFIKDTAIVSSLENKISSKVCEMFSSFTGKAEDFANKVKPTTPDSNGVAMSATQPSNQVAGKETGFMDSVKNLFTK
jgi:hypothetical protein